MVGREGVEGLWIFSVSTRAGNIQQSAVLAREGNPVLEWALRGDRTQNVTCMLDLLNTTAGTPKNPCRYLFGSHVNLTQTAVPLTVVNPKKCLVWFFTIRASTFRRTGRRFITISSSCGMSSHHFVSQQYWKAYIHD